ncbi:MAG: metallophosphoesterase [Christensenellaceae bacterium]|jgi:predicted phosphohydrolase|nr:metallophosphoesterase [Christensenellaceae bacterium]
MRLFAVGDLHLPGSQNKPMDVFGGHWEGHFGKIAEDWAQKVGEDDLVLLPGDLSWAMSFEDALPDLQAIFALPGQKVLLRGNHDYWWPAISRLRAVLPPNAYVLQNDAAPVGGYVVAGSRGWIIPREGRGDKQDEKIYQRELMRLELSLKDAQKKAAGRPIVGMLHYPPSLEGGEKTGFTELFSAYGVKAAVYGHLHAEGLAGAFNGPIGGVHYQNVSCDGLGFKLKELHIGEEK